jgi:hypothetical protein
LISDEAEYHSNNKLYNAVYYTVHFGIELPLARNWSLIFFTALGLEVEIDKDQHCHKIFLRISKLFSISGVDYQSFLSPLVDSICRPLTLDNPKMNYL